MYTAAYEILRDHYLCEDAIHNAFIRIMNNLDCLDEITCHKTKAFVVIVVENESKRIYSKRKKNAVFLFDESGEAIPDTNQDIDNLIQKIDEEIIMKQLEALPADDANILTLKYFQELKDKEIARVLHISDSAVRKRLERARVRLAVLLQKSSSGGGEDA